MLLLFSIVVNEWSFVWKRDVVRIFVLVLRKILSSHVYIFFCLEGQIRI